MSPFARHERAVTIHPLTRAASVTESASSEAVSDSNVRQLLTFGFSQFRFFLWFS